MAPLIEDTVWLGDLAGFEVWVALGEDFPTLGHRCGWTTDLASVDAYLGNLILKAMEHRKHGCEQY